MKEMKESNTQHLMKIVEHEQYQTKDRSSAHEKKLFAKVTPEKRTHESFIGEELHEVTLPAEVRDRIEAQKKKEVKRFWIVYDSPLLQDLRIPRHKDPSFDCSFESVLPRWQNLKKYIEGTLDDRAGNVLALELGGPGSALFSGFTEGFIAESRGITLVDNRLALGIDPADDAIRNHDVIAGNMLEADTKREVMQWLGGRKLDLILERMRGGLALLPDDPRYLVHEVAFWYQQLAPGGVLIAEVPPAFDTDISAWAEEARKTNLDVQLGQIGHYERHNLNRIHVVRIHKKEGAPEAFPFLRKSA